jgi:hypothetical protein
MFFDVASTPPLEEGTIGLKSLKRAYAPFSLSAKFSRSFSTFGVAT